MRCPSCNKFPSFEISDPEVDIDLDGPHVTGNVRLPITTSCCGEEVKEGNFEIDIDLESEFIDALKAAGVPEPENGFDFAEAEFEVESDDCGWDDRYADKDQKGKPITNYRYRKHYYGIHLTVTASCKYPHDGGTVDVSVEATHDDEVQASGMDELV